VQYFVKLLFLLLCRFISSKGNGESLHYVTKAWQQGEARAQSTRVNIFYQFDLNSVP
jgi:hypothetical protein